MFDFSLKLKNNLSRNENIITPKILDQWVLVVLTRIYLFVEITTFCLKRNIT